MGGRSFVKLANNAAVKALQSKRQQYFSRPLQMDESHVGLLILATLLLELLPLAHPVLFAGRRLGSDRVSYHFFADLPSPQETLMTGT